MNNRHRIIEKMLIKQMDAEELPAIPLNRHQRRAIQKRGKK